MIEDLYDSELSVVASSSASTRTLLDEGTTGQSQLVNTDFGLVSVSVCGDLSHPVILTYHDLGLNHVTNFQAFFNHPEMREVVSLFCIVHVNAVGQEEGAPTLPKNFKYPTMDELADTITKVKDHLGIRSFTGFGVGLGANVLVRYAVRNPKHVESLVLVNCSSTSAGYVERMSQWMNTTFVNNRWLLVSYLLWHHFGRPHDCNQDLVTVYRENFRSTINFTNLSHLINSYINRTDLDIGKRVQRKIKGGKHVLHCPILNMTSTFSGHIDDVEKFNERLTPTVGQYMKVQDCGLLIDERPGKVVEALRLHLCSQYHVDLMPHLSRCPVLPIPSPVVLDDPGMAGLSRSDIQTHHWNSEEP